MRWRWSHRWGSGNSGYELSGAERDRAVDVREQVEGKNRVECRHDGNGAKNGPIKPHSEGRGVTFSHHTAHVCPLCRLGRALAVEASAAHPLVPRLDVAEEVRGHEGESVTQGVCARAAECGTMRERESQRDKENEDPSIGRGRTDKSQPLQALQKRGVGGASRRGEGLKGGEFFCAATPRWLTLARSMLQDTNSCFKRLVKTLRSARGMISVGLAGAHRTPQLQ